MPKRPEPKETPVDRPVKPKVVIDHETGIVERFATCTTCGGAFTAAICPTDGTKLHE